MSLFDHSVRVLSSSLASPSIREAITYYRLYPIGRHQRDIIPFYSSLCPWLSIVCILICFLMCLHNSISVLLLLIIIIIIIIIYTSYFRRYRNLSEGLSLIIILLGIQNLFYRQVPYSILILGTSINYVTR